MESTAELGTVNILDKIKTKQKQLVNILTQHRIQKTFHMVILVVPYLKITHLSETGKDKL